MDVIGPADNPTHLVVRASEAEIRKLRRRFSRRLTIEPNVPFSPT